MTPDSVVKEMLKLLEAVCEIRDSEDKESFSNQGQAMDGFSMLANYNDIADQIKKFLDNNKADQIMAKIVKCHQIERR